MSTTIYATVSDSIAADEAVGQLVSAGFERSAIVVQPGSRHGLSTTTAPSGRQLPTMLSCASTSPMSDRNIQLCVTTSDPVERLRVEDILAENGAADIRCHSASPLHAHRDIPIREPVGPLSPFPDRHVPC